MSGGVNKGHGDGNVSPMEWLVGRYVPVTTRGSGVSPGNGLAAKSSSLSVTLVIPPQHPPASDMIMAVCPPGPISSMSMSTGLVWVMLFSLTVTLVTAPGIPATTIFEG
jgi:hypothetical protein